MNKRIFSIMVILAVIAAAFFYASGSQQSAFVGAARAEETSLSAKAGIAAHTNIGTVVLEAVKPAFLMVEYEDVDYFVGTLDMPLYDAIYDPLVLVTAAGDIVAFYENTDPAGKIVDVVSKNLDETLLEKAVKIVAAAAGAVPTSISHYDFGNPDAANMLLVAEVEPDGNAFTLQFEGSNDYYEKSYAFYRNYGPSFTLDNDSLDQVDFVEANANYIGAPSFGTIYGDFSVIDFDPGDLNTFAVEAGDHLAFGALAILYAGDAPTVADADFSKTIPLASPGVDPVFDLTPDDFSKKSVTGRSLEPTLSWDASTAPNYEYCIDIEEVNNGECDTSWISTGSDTFAELSNLLYETTYYWQVRAVNSYAVVEADGGTWWSYATTTPGVAPEAFAKDGHTLKEPTDSLSKVTMTWTPSYGAYYYEVCVDTTADCVAPELWHNVGLATSATIGDLLLDTTYYWQVRAVNDFGVVEADSEAWQSFTTRTFSKLRPVDGEVYNLTLPFKWEETPIAASGYEYCFVPGVPDIEPNPEACDWKKTADTSVVVNFKKNKMGAGIYYWQVRVNIGTPNVPVWVYANPEDAGGNPLPTGDWWMFEVLSKKDARKINLFKVSPVDGAVDQPTFGLGLSWNTTGTNMSYEYCFFDVDDTDTTPISDDDHCTYPTDENPNPWVNVGNDTSTTITTIVTPNEPLGPTTYYWQVRADLGDSYLYADKGDYWAFTTLPYVPPDPVLTD